MGEGGYWTHFIQLDLILDFLKSNVLEEISIVFKVF